MTEMIDMTDMMDRAGVPRETPAVSRGGLRALEASGQGALEQAADAEKDAEKFVIEGGVPLAGRVRVSGSKNTTLPCMLCALLTSEPVTLTNVPDLLDVRVMRLLLRHLGVRCEFTPDWQRGGTMRLQQEEAPDTIPSEIPGGPMPVAPMELVARMRASFLVLGPLVARFGAARVGLPGGCAIGARPVNLHLWGLRQLGVQLTQRGNWVEARAPASGLRGARIVLPQKSVGVTEHLMLGAALASGETILENAAREPEIVALAYLLNKMAPRPFVFGAGGETLRILGQKRLGGADCAMVGDRIEAGSFLLGAALGEGSIQIEGIAPSLLDDCVSVLRQMGYQLVLKENALFLPRQKLLTKRPVTIETAPWPGFSTDLQPFLVALLGRLPGVSTLTETVFENRFHHIKAMNHFGARMRVAGRQVRIEGPVLYQGRTAIRAPDIRGGAGLVFTALAALGRSEISNLQLIDRGYEALEQKLTGLGARLKRVKAAEGRAAPLAAAAAPDTPGPTPGESVAGGRISRR